MKKIIKFFEDYCYGDRKKKEYMAAAIVSLVIILITIFVVPVILYFNVAEAETLMKIWLGTIIVSIGVASPIIGHAFLMLKSKKFEERNKERAKRKLSSTWSPFRYKPHDQNRFIRSVISRSNLKFEAKIENDIIQIKVLSPEGDLIHMEKTRDYYWFNGHFSPLH